MELISQYRNLNIPSLTINVIRIYTLTSALSDKAYLLQEPQFLGLVSDVNLKRPLVLP
jgi:hypothetical protein